MPTHARTHDDDKVGPASTQTLPREVTFNAAARTLQQLPITELADLRGQPSVVDGPCLRVCVRAFVRSPRFVRFCRFASTVQTLWQTRVALAAAAAVVEVVFGCLLLRLDDDDDDDV